MLLLIFSQDDIERPKSVVMFCLQLNSTPWTLPFCVAFAGEPNECCHLSSKCQEDWSKTPWILPFCVAFASKEPNNCCHHPSNCVQSSGVGDTQAAGGIAIVVQLSKSQAFEKQHRYQLHTSNTIRALKIEPAAMRISLDTFSTIRSTIQEHVPKCARSFNEQLRSVMSTQLMNTPLISNQNPNQLHPKWPGQPNPPHGAVQGMNPPPERAKPRITFLPTNHPSWSQIHRLRHHQQLQLALQHCPRRRLRQ